MKKRLSTFAALVGGGLVVGSFDICYAILFWRISRDIAPARVFQSVAAGVLGPASFTGGTKTAILGAFLHYFIAFSVVTIYWIAAKLLPVLRRYALICGPLYGIGVYLVMTYVVVPLSNSRPSKTFNLVWVVCSLIVHAFLIGLPSALFARASQPETQS
jgi:hypothetical protein